MRRETVKDRSTRHVERQVTGDGADVHVKRVLLRGHPWRRLAALLGRDKAAREARNLRRLAALGVRAAEVVSVATRRAAGIPLELVLTTRTLPGFERLPEGAESDPATAVALGAFLRSLHDRGVFHEDLHRGNLLRDPSGAFALVDADRMRFGPDETPARRRRGLLDALRAFRALRAEPAWRAFLEGYGAAAAGIDAADLAVAADADLRAHLRLRSRRALRDNPDFGPCDAGALRWQVRRGFAPPADPEPVLADPAALVKRSRSSTVAWLGGGAVLKVFHPWTFRGRLSAWLRGSRARRAFRHGHLLELLDIPTAPVLGFAEPGRGPARPRSYLVTGRLPDAGHATAFLAATAEPARRRSFLAAAGTLVGRLHASGLAHRDLKGRNLLRVAGDACSLVDLDGLEVRRIVSDSVRLRDLRRAFRSGREVASLGLREAFAFLRAYRRASGRSPAAPLLRMLLEI